MMTCHSTQIDSELVPPVPDKLWHRIFLAVACNVQFEPMTHVVKRRMPGFNGWETNRSNAGGIKKI